MVDIAVEAINLEGSINKTTSCNTGRSIVSKQEANKAVNLIRELSSKCDLELLLSPNQSNPNQEISI